MSPAPTTSPLVRSPRPARAPFRRWAGAAAVATGTVIAWWFVLSQATGPLPTPGVILARSLAFLDNLLGGATQSAPAFTQASQWRAMGGLVVDTLIMSIVAMGLAGAGLLATVGAASRLSTVGVVGTERRWVGRVTVVATRGVHALFRAVPELIWAMLIVFVLRPGILAGAIALALHEFGVLGRLGSDVVDDLDPHPLRSLKSAGARPQQLLVFGALPQVLPQLVTFLLYRWEIVIRATVVVGFITGAGLGHQLRLALSFRRWTEVALILMAYVLLVWSVEALASGLRRLAR